MANKKHISRKTSSQQTHTNEPTAVSHEQIAQRAYSIWIEQGCPLGCDLDNWLKAEEELHRAAKGELTGDFDVDARFTNQIEEELDDLAAQPGPRSSTSLG